jgi:hypothetical protein
MRFLICGQGQNKVGSANQQRKRMPV